MLRKLWDRFTRAEPTPKWPTMTDVLVFPQKFEEALTVEWVGQNIEQYLPAYETAGSSGMDLRADIKEPLKMAKGVVYKIPTGIKVQIPDPIHTIFRYEGSRDPGPLKQYSIPVTFDIQVRPRSGLATKGFTVVNSPGTIDQDYTGELIIIGTSFTTGLVINPGDRIAQLVVGLCAKPQIKAGTLQERTTRGEAGFGSTGAA